MGISFFLKTGGRYKHESSDWDFPTTYKYSNLLLGLSKLQELNSCKMADNEVYL